MAAKTWQGPILGIHGCRGGPESFREGHNILKIKSDDFLRNVKTNFVVFSEYMKFNFNHVFMRVWQQNLFSHAHSFIYSSPDPTTNFETSNPEFP